MELLRHACFEVMLAIRLHLADAIVGFGRRRAEEVRQQYIFKLRRREEAVIAGVQAGARGGHVVREPKAWAQLHECVCEVEEVVAQPDVGGEVCRQSHMVLHVAAGLTTAKTLAESKG